MPTGNFDEPVISDPQPPVTQRSFRLPADYYSAPLSEVKPFFPSWVPWGCGAAAVLALLIMFGAGALLTGPRLAAALDMVIGMTLAEVKKFYTDEVTPAQQASFDGSVESMREQLRAGKVPLEKVQPFLQEMQKSIGDEKVTPEELERLTAAAQKAAR